MQTFNIFVTINDEGTIIVADTMTKHIEVSMNRPNFDECQFKKLISEYVKIGKCKMNNEFYQFVFKTARECLVPDIALLECQLPKDD